MNGASSGLSGRKAGMSKAKRIFQPAQKGADAYGMYKARRLVLIGDPGSVVLSRAPRALSIIDWASRHHRVEVQVCELKDKDEA